MWVHYFDILELESDINFAKSTQNDTLNMFIKSVESHSAFARNISN